MEQRPFSSSPKQLKTGGKNPQQQQYRSAAQVSARTSLMYRQYDKSGEKRQAMRHRKSMSKKLKYSLKELPEIEQALRMGEICSQKERVGKKKGYVKPKIQQKNEANEDSSQITVTNSQTQFSLKMRSQVVDKEQIRAKLAPLYIITPNRETEQPNCEILNLFVQQAYQRLKQAEEYCRKLQDSQVSEMLNQRRPQVLKYLADRIKQEKQEILKLLMRYDSLKCEIAKTQKIDKIKPKRQIK